MRSSGSDRRGGGWIERDYRPAFLAYLARQDERSRTAGYELGRRAVVREVGLLELVAAHHVTLLEVLPEAADGEAASAMFTAAAEFLTEVLASSAMASAAVPELQERLAEAEERLRTASEEVDRLRARSSRGE